MGPKNRKTLHYYSLTAYHVLARSRFLELEAKRNYKSANALTT